VLLFGANIFFSIFVVERQNSLINISAEFSVLLYPENEGVESERGVFVGAGPLPLGQPGDRHPLITEICKKEFSDYYISSSSVFQITVIR
jgi:hypothetical protein